MIWQKTFLSIIGHFSRKKNMENIRFTNFDLFDVFQPNISKKKLYEEN